MIQDLLCCTRILAIPADSQCGDFQRNPPRFSGPRTSGSPRTDLDQDGTIAGDFNRKPLPNQLTDVQVRSRLLAGASGPSGGGDDAPGGCRVGQRPGQLIRVRHAGNFPRALVQVRQEEIRLAGAAVNGRCTAGVGQCHGLVSPVTEAIGLDIAERQACAKKESDVVFRRFLPANHLNQRRPTSFLPWRGVSPSSITSARMPDVSSRAMDGCP